MTLISWIKVIVTVTFHNFAYISAILKHFYKIVTTMKALWPATKKVLLSDLENVGQGHHLLQNSLYFSYYTTDFKRFHRNDGTVASNKNVISADLENVGQGYHLQKSISRLLYSRFY